mmetsp:Transcript_13506/g.57655  ORF Transcript_13506/g.57655 Transcript_13506/m.57655 type:complete len:269 (+) Transcript_13506:585-1391(+)
MGWTPRTHTARVRSRSRGTRERACCARCAPPSPSFSAASRRGREAKAEAPQKRCSSRLGASRGGPRRRPTRESNLRPTTRGCSSRRRSTRRTCWTWCAPGTERCSRCGPRKPSRRRARRVKTSTTKTRRRKKNETETTTTTRKRRSFRDWVLLRSFRTPRCLRDGSLLWSISSRSTANESRRRARRKSRCAARISSLRKPPTALHCRSPRSGSAWTWAPRPGAGRSGSPTDSFRRVCRGTVKKTPTVSAAACGRWTPGTSNFLRFRRT